MRRSGLRISLRMWSMWSPMLDARPVTDGGYSRGCPVASGLLLPGPAIGRGPWLPGWLFVQPSRTLPRPIQAVDHPPSPNDPPRAIRNSAHPPPAEHGYRRDRAPRPARRATDVAAFRRGLSGWAVPEPTHGMLSVFQRRGRGPYVPRSRPTALGTHMLKEPAQRQRFPVWSCCPGTGGFRTGDV